MSTTDRPDLPAAAAAAGATVPATVPALPERGPLDLNPAAVYLAGKPSEVGRRGLERALNRAAEILTDGLTTDALTVDWTELRYQHVMALRALLIDQGAAPATISHLLSALRGVVKEAFNLGLINADTMMRVAAVKSVSASNLPAGRHVDAGDVRRLFDTCSDGDTVVGARDAALLALLYGCGLRRSEVVALELTDYDSGALTVRSGKGRKARIVYAPTGGRAAVDAWLARRGFWPGALLAPVAKGGKIQHRAMTAQAVLVRLRYLADQAGISRFSPHDLRRSFVGELLDAGADISSVQQLAGHANVATTQRYDRRPEEAKRRAAELLHVPYVAPPSLQVPAATVAAQADSPPEPDPGPPAEDADSPPPADERRGTP